jgi:hypothetical protein
MWRLVPWEGIGNLLCRPFLAGLFGVREVHEAAPIRGEDQKDKQNADAGCWYGKNSIEAI